MKEILKKPWDYILYENGAEMILSVLCGTTIEFFLNIELNSSEKEEYFQKGKVTIDELASKIRYDPSAYKARHIEIKQQ